MAVCTDNISTVGMNSDLKHAEEDILLCVAGWRLKHWKPSECAAMCSQPMQPRKRWAHPRHIENKASIQHCRRCLRCVFL